MSRGSPSLVALLGLLAVGGYQNRAKLGELINGRAGQDPSGTGNSGGLMDQLGQMLGGGGGSSSGMGATSGGLGVQSGGAQTGSMMSGLTEMFERFTGADQAEKAQSWVRSGPNAPLAPMELEQVLDEETLAELTQKTGLSRTELLTRLSDVLPEAVDQVSPDGHLPRVAGGPTGTY